MNRHRLWAPAIDAGRGRHTDLKGGTWVDTILTLTKIVLTRLSRLFRPASNPGIDLVQDDTMKHNNPMDIEIDYLDGPRDRPTVWTRYLSLSPLFAHASLDLYPSRPCFVARFTVLKLHYRI